MGRVVCPNGAPNTMGTRSGARMRRQTSRTVTVLSAGVLAIREISQHNAAHAAKFPRLQQDAPACDPADRVSPRGLPASRIAPRVSNSHGVPSVVSTSVDAAAEQQAGRFAARERLAIE